MRAGRRSTLLVLISIAASGPGYSHPSYLSGAVLPGAQTSGHHLRFAHNPFDTDPRPRTRTYRQAAIDHIIPCRKGGKSIIGPIYLVLKAVPAPRKAPAQQREAEVLAPRGGWTKSGFLQQFGQLHHDSRFLRPVHRNDLGGEAVQGGLENLPLAEGSVYTARIAAQVPKHLSQEHRIA
jgi:hypothetical protein